jgi:hypothetical protein
MYGKAENVMMLTGAKHQALGFRTDQDLSAFIADRLNVATGYIESDRGRTYADGTSNFAIASEICERMVANFIRAMERQRNKSIVTVEGGELEVASDEPNMFTAAIKADIKRLPRTPIFRIASTLTYDESVEREIAQ